MNKTNIKRNVMTARAFRMLATLAVVAIFAFWAKGTAAGAADDKSLEVCEIDYNKSTITIMMNSNDTVLYLSNEAQKKWEYVPAKFKTVNYKTDADGRIVICAEGNKTAKVAVLDISWVSIGKNYVMSFKGDYSVNPIKVTVPKQLTTFKASYDSYAGAMKLTGVPSGDYSIEWKKKDAIGWNTYNADTFKNEIAALIDNGASLQFRVAAVNGVSADKTGSRASKEVSVTISKKTAAPAITVNDERLIIGVKKGLNYRYVDASGYPVSEGWSSFTKDSDAALSDIAAKAMISEDNKTPEDVYIQFFQAATSASQVSKKKTIKIPAQEPMTKADLDKENNSYITYTSKSNFNMTFKTAGESNKLEYCIITVDMQKLGITIDDITNENLKWTEVSTSEPIGKSRDTDSKLVDGGLIYYRRKAQETLGSDKYKLASPAELLGKIHYPAGAQAEDFTLLRTIDGMCRNGNNCLTFSFGSDTKGDIKKIEFRTGGSSIGVPEYTSSVSTNTADNSYTYTVTITDLSGVTKTGTLMYAYIYFGNEASPDVATIQSNSEKGIGLYIYPKSEINNPSGETATTTVAKKLASAGNKAWDNYSFSEDTIGFTTAIKRVFNSNRILGETVNGEKITEGTADQRQFRVKIDMGSLNNPDLSEGTDATKVEDYKADKVSVTGIKYDSILLSGDDTIDGAKYFNVEYYEDKKTVSGREVAYRVAVLTINADAVEKNMAIDDRDKDGAVQIFLSNGEVIKSGLTMNLQRTASPAELTSISFTQGKLEAWNTVKKTDSSGVVTETKERAEDKYYKIVLNVPSTLGNKSSYSVGVSEVTWNGKNILYKASRSGNIITITLDSDLLNQINVGATGETHYINIELSNGYKIMNGIPMTISPAPTT